MNLRETVLSAMFLSGLLCSVLQAGESVGLAGLELTGINGKSAPAAGYGMFAALSFDEGKTWPVRRLLADGPERAVTTIDNGTVKYGGKYSELTGYLALAQGYDGTVHLISSKNHYAFNLAWLTEYAEKQRMK